MSARPDGPHNAPPIADLRARAQNAIARQRPANASTAEAPDPGKVLLRAPRPDGTELRVSAHTYEGKPYVRVAPWQQSGGAWWPVKGKGCTVKVRELAQVAAALLDAAEATP